MRGSDVRSKALFSFVDLEERIPARHSLRTIRRIADEALSGREARSLRAIGSGSAAWTVTGVAAAAAAAFAETSATVSREPDRRLPINR